MLKLKSKSSAATIAVVGIGAVIGTGVAVATSDNSGVGTPAVAKATSITGDLRAFPILRRAQQGAPDTATTKLLDGPSRSGQNISLARATAGPDGPVWIAPGRDKLCINMPDPVDGFGVVCADAARARKEGALGIMVDPKTPNVKKISLVLPDGANATVTSPEGTVRPLSSTDGVVNEAIDGAQAVTVTAPDGSTKVYDLPGPIPVHPTPEEKALAAAEAAAESK